MEWIIKKITSNIQRIEEKTMVRHYFETYYKFFKKI